MIVGLTGGTGTGKSSVSRCFADEGFFVVDFDALSRKVSDVGSPCLKELTDEFGDGIVNADGTLDRRGLGRIVFADKDKLAILNKITHKYILKETEKIMKDHRDDMLLFDAPLLFEAGLEKYCDYVVSVTAERELRIRRICDRDSIDYATAVGRIDSQKPDSYYTEQSDYVITNNSDIQSLQSQATKIIRSIFDDYNRV